GEGVEVQAGKEPSLRPVDHRIGIGAAMVDHAVVNAEAAREERRAAREARDVGGVDALEEDGSGCDGIDFWACRTVIAGAAQVVGTPGVDVDVEQSHGLWLPSMRSAGIAPAR